MIDILTFKPMLARKGEAPFNDKDWVFEQKLDGVRCIAVIGKDGSVVLTGRSNKDLTVSFPDVAKQLSGVGTDCVVDGEIICPDDATGFPNFNSLQHRLHRKSQDNVNNGVSDYPAQLMAFDIIESNGVDVKNEPYTKRRNILRTLLPSEFVLDYFFEEGELIYNWAVNNGLEGIMAKKKDMLYEPGKRSKSMLKIKPIEEDSFMVLGWMKGTGNREGKMGSLIIGKATGYLTYECYGAVGTGFNFQDLDEWTERIANSRQEGRPTTITNTRGIEKDPQFAGWIAPDHIIDVRYAEITEDKSLRFPAYMRIRENEG